MKRKHQEHGIDDGASRQEQLRNEFANQGLPPVMGPREAAYATT